MDEGTSFLGFESCYRLEDLHLSKSAALSLTFFPVVYSLDLHSLSSLSLYSAVSYLLLVVVEITLFFNSHPFSALITGYY